ncbi:MAG: hypothetical protein Q7R43_02030 [Candidatus Daviesbacteria bacterium]|nr:hypothetical protein [Candidatus Daviesbacteria bacterium]
MKSQKGLALSNCEFVKKESKGFVHILALLLLIAGLAASIYLVGQKTNLFSRAYSPNPPKYLSGPISTPTPKPISSPISPTTAVCPNKVVCDINGDRREDINDGNLVKGCWNKPATGTCQKVDVVCDKKITVADIQKFSYQCPQIFVTPTPTPVSVIKGGPFNITMSVNSMTITCRVNQTDCFISTVIGTNKIGQNLYNATIYSNRSGFIRFMGFDGKWNEPGSKSKNTQTIQPERGFNILAGVKSFSRAGVYQDTLYIDAQTCNQKVNPPDCVYYGATSIPFKVVVK